MQFASIGSGSKGNATLVRAADTLLMIDCGFSVRETTRRLERFGVTPADLDAILVTHEHSDHASGVPGLSRRYGIPVYLTHGTALTGRCDGTHEQRCINCEDSFTVGDLRVTAITVPHDAAEPCQYRLEYGDLSLGILTDLGTITPHVVERYRGCNSLLLEFNHDEAMLFGGAYPPHLKRRVGGDWGHLNNAQAAHFLREVDCSGLRHLVVAHVSENNNCLELARSAVASAMETLDRVVFADQHQGFGWLDVG